MGITTTWEVRSLNRNFSGFRSDFKEYAEKNFNYLEGREVVFNYSHHRNVIKERVSELVFHVANALFEMLNDSNGFILNQLNHEKITNNLNLFFEDLSEKELKDFIDIAKNDEKLYSFMVEKDVMYSVYNKKVRKRIEDEKFSAFQSIILGKHYGQHIPINVNEMLKGRLILENIKHENFLKAIDKNRYSIAVSVFHCLNALVRSDNSDELLELKEEIEYFVHSIEKRISELIVEKLFSPFLFSSTFHRYSDFYGISRRDLYNHANWIRSVFSMKQYSSDVKNAYFTLSSFDILKWKTIY